MIRAGSFIRKHYLAVGVFAVSMIAVLWFAGTLLLDFIYFNDPRHKDETLKPWMTPRYVAMSYDLPRPMLEDLFQLTPQDRGRIRLSDIAAREGMTLDELNAMVVAAAAAHRANSQ